MRSVRLILLGSLLAGAMLVVGAGQSSAWTNSCNNGETVTPGVPPTGEDLGVDVGPGIAFVGVDLELVELLSGNPGPIVCVNNDELSFRVNTSGGVYVTLKHCTYSNSCPPVLDDTGLKPSGPTTINILPATTIDPGYDLYVDGTNLTP